jgi:CRP/FNR family transcriptional regulator, cyclic AMP receptor protein
MEVNELLKAIQSLNTEDAFRPRLTLDQWRVVATFLAPHELRPGDLLIKQGDVEHTMYFLGRGTLQVFVAGRGTADTQIALLRPGAVVGETGLFGDFPRMANVEAMTPCTVWALRGPRLEELVQRSPVLALELIRAAAAVMLTRIRANQARKIAFV